MPYLLPSPWPSPFSVPIYACSCFANVRLFLLYASCRADIQQWLGHLSSKTMVCDCMANENRHGLVLISSFCAHFDVPVCLEPVLIDKGCNLDELRLRGLVDEAAIENEERAGVTLTAGCQPSRRILPPPPTD